MDPNSLPHELLERLTEELAVLTSKTILRIETGHS